MVNPLEIACFSSAAVAALAYIAYKATDGQSTLPIGVDGKMVFVPKTLIDIMFDLSRFSLGYNAAMARIHEGPRLPDDQYALVLQADKECHVVRRDFNRLYDHVASTCAKGEEVEEDLMAYREQQKMKICEIQELLGDYLKPACDCPN